MTRLATLAVALAGAGMAQAGCTFSWKAAAGDTCASMASDWGISVDDFIKWNPAVGKDCSAIWADYFYCIAVPGTPDHPGPVVPTPHQDGIAKNCKKYYKVQSGDYCDKIIKKYNKSFNLKQL